MSRLIDADNFPFNALIQWVEQGENGASVNLYQKFLNEIPTVDPVKHGHWVDGGDCDCQCSVCKSEWYSFDRPDDVEEWKFEARYCPKCGAKMDEEV